MCVWAFLQVHSSHLGMELVKSGTGRTGIPLMGVPEGRAINTHDTDELGPC